MLYICSLSFNTQTYEANNFKYLMIGVLIISSISCMDKERDLSWERRHMPKEAYFDFNMIQAVALDVDYCFKSDNYRVLFDIYDQDPLNTQLTVACPKRT